MRLSENSTWVASDHPAQRNVISGFFAWTRIGMGRACEQGMDVWSIWLLLILAIAALMLLPKLGPPSHPSNRSEYWDTLNRPDAGEE